MSGHKLLALLLAAGAAGVATTWPANAQCRLCDKPSTAGDETTAKEDVQLQIDSGINFDRLIMFGEGTGAAVLRPDGSNSTIGAVTDLSPRAMVGSAVVHGEPGRAVRVELPSRIDLYSVSGSRITFDEVVSDLPSIPRLDSAGTLSFRFGGRVTIVGDADGQFRGDLPITVEYL